VFMRSPNFVELRHELLRRDTFIMLAARVKRAPRLSRMSRFEIKRRPRLSISPMRRCGDMSSVSRFRCSFRSFKKRRFSAMERLFTSCRSRSISVRSENTQIGTESGRHLKSFRCFCRPRASGQINVGSASVDGWKWRRLAHQPLTTRRVLVQRRQLNAAFIRYFERLLKVMFHAWASHSHPFCVRPCGSNLRLLGKLRMLSGLCKAVEIEERNRALQTH
jgi:hypothetical protein